jgi:hypothetical protein
MRDLKTAEAIAVHSQPFEWGKCDCYTFTANVVHAVTGKDFRDLFDYRSERDALKLIRSKGGFLAVVTHVLGEPCSPKLCQSGDPVLLMNEGREMLGVMFQRCIVVKTALSVRPVPLDLALYGWRL